MNVRRPQPIVHIKKSANPWDGTFDDGVLQGFLLNAAKGGEELAGKWIKAGSADSDASFIQVYLDPNMPRSGGLSVADRIFAIVTYGDRSAALGHLDAAGEEADLANPHGLHSYRGAVSACAGLSRKQNRDLTQLTLIKVMDGIQLALDLRTRERRQASRHAWQGGGGKHQLRLNANGWHMSSSIV